MGQLQFSVISRAQAWQRNTPAIARNHSSSHREQHLQQQHKQCKAAMLRAAANALWRQLPRALGPPQLPAAALRWRQLHVAPLCCMPPPTAASAKAPAIPPVKRITRGAHCHGLNQPQCHALRIHRLSATPQPAPAFQLHYHHATCPLGAPCPPYADDVDIQFARSSGAGGQNVNKVRPPKAYLMPALLSHGRRRCMY